MTSAKVARLVVAALATVLVATEARAADATDASVPAAESDAESARARAEAAYAEGERAYAAGNFAEAASAFERAYALSHIPELLFDIGQAHRQAGPAHCEAARQSYSAYLESAPDSEHRAAVEERLQQLSACSKAVRAAPSSEEAEQRQAPLAQESRVESAPSSWPWLVIGSGAAVATAGGVLLLRAKLEYDDVKSQCPCPRGRFDDWERLTYLGYALAGVGAATTGVGLVLWRTETSRATAQLVGVPGGIELRGTF